VGEFASIGVLPLVASSLSVSEPTAGLLISAYALGVVIGAPVLAILGARLPRRSLLLALMALFGLAQVGSALAPNFPVLVATRFGFGGVFAVYTYIASTLTDVSGIPADGFLRSFRCSGSG
jgi:DHA1 family inner membrane transport protein